MLLLHFLKLQLVATAWHRQSTDLQGILVRRSDALIMSNRDLSVFCRSCFLQVLFLQVLLADTVLLYHASTCLCWNIR